MGLRRDVDIAKAFFPVPDEAFRLQLGEHGANRRVARRIQQTLANVLGRGTVSERKDGIHNLALTAGQLLMRR